MARRDFIVSDTNRDAVDALDAWPSWPGGRLALVGPAGSGKTHLANAWAERTGAALYSGNLTDLSSVAGKSVLFEDVDRGTADEALFHLINMAEVGGALLLTGRTAPLEWKTELPDLRSRLNATMVATIRAPDDAVLEGVLVKLFAERNIRPSRDVLAFLLKRIERSVSSAQWVVARIDERAGADRREITRPLAREVLEMGGYEAGSI